MRSLPTSSWSGHSSASGRSSRIALRDAFAAASGQMTGHPQPVPLRLHPAAQPRPGGDERLVRQRDGVVVQCQQPCPHQAFHHGGGALRVAEVQFAPCRGAAGVGRAVAGVDQSQQHPARVLGLGLGEGGVDLLGGAGDRLAEQGRDWQHANVVRVLDRVARLDRVGDDELLQPRSHDAGNRAARQHAVADIASDQRRTVIEQGFGRVHQCAA